MKKSIYAMIVLVILAGLCSCESPVNQSNYITPVAENPDTVAVQYNNGVQFLEQYSTNNEIPDLTINRVEHYDSVNHYLDKGFLLIYYENKFIDTVTYGPNREWPGVIMPSIYCGRINSNQFLLKVCNGRDNLYSAAISTWYYINNPSITKLAKVTTKDGNGMYENNNANFDNVKKFNNKLIFSGSYYCLRETFCTFDLFSTFHNYSRFRTNCYEQWQWE
jgi:hypothetical protein